MPSDRATLTPPQFARRYGVGVAKVLAWISQNELRAINVVSEAGKRPRWVILPDAVDQFEARRSNHANTERTPLRRRRASGDYTRFQY